jgi:LysR family transcriptional regulator, low CO2-responsive transcriptional regulator
MNYTLHQLDIFAEVIRQKSITRAAEALHMTQPAVSIQLKQLQESVDVPLIHFVGRSLHLTEAGEELLSMQHIISEKADAFEEYVSELKGGLKGNLKISAASTAKYFLPYILGAFQKKYPHVKISLKVTNRNEVLQHIQKNEYQLAILTQLPAETGIISHAFLENPLVMACHPDHPLRSKRSISLKELGNESFVFREPGSGTRMVMEKLLSDSGIKPYIAMELGTNEAVKQAVMAGIGISLISKISMYSELNLGSVAQLQVKHLPVQTHWHTIYKTDKVISRVIRNFLDFLQNEDLFALIPSSE